MKTKINSTYPKHDAEFFNELLRQANRGTQAVRLLRTYYPKTWQMTFENGETQAHGASEATFCDSYEPLRILVPASSGVQDV